MQLDKQNMFSDDQALTASAVSTNVIDLGAAYDVGPGEPVELLIQLTADSGGTSPTLKAALQASTDEAFTSPVVVGESATLSDGNAGDKLSLNYIPPGPGYRYLRLNYTLGGTTPTYTVVAGVVAGAQTNK